MAKISRKSLKQIRTQIENAIERSESHNEIARITIGGDSGDVLAEINALTDCETDYAMYDREGVDVMDIWGFEEGSDEMLWRLNITFRCFDPQKLTH